MNSTAWFALAVGFTYGILFSLAYVRFVAWREKSEVKK